MLVAVAALASIAAALATIGLADAPLEKNDRRTLVVTTALLALFQATALILRLRFAAPLDLSLGSVGVTVAGWALFTAARGAHASHDEQGAPPTPPSPRSATAARRRPMDRDPEVLLLLLRDVLDLFRSPAARASRRPRA